MKDSFPVKNTQLEIWYKYQIDQDCSLVLWDCEETTDCLFQRQLYFIAFKYPEIKMA